MLSRAGVQGWSAAAAQVGILDIQKATFSSESVFLACGVW